ncbi:hypothetical protein NE237_010792 [Protea cynaroides]|uniref:Cytochrome P450 n=1 Tax=Protea cynaroides TaxID=273540 RepID=A0A9Q0L0D4_9MAGN|nr:hypothetical protein NE237_010792 [Protea cynaroides]
MNTNIACIRLGNIHVVPVTCPKLACEFLRKHDSVFAFRPITVASQSISRGFLTVGFQPWVDEQWKKMRKLMVSEIISSKRLRWLHDKRIEEADNLVRYVYNQCSNNIGGGAVLDARVLGWQYCGNVVRRFLFNKRYFGKGRADGGPGVEEEEHIDAVFTALSFLFAFCISDYLPWLRWLDLDGHQRMVKEALEVFNKYHDPVIDERLQELRDGKDGWHDLKREPQDLLDVFILLKDDKGKPLLSTEEIRAQAVELFLAAVDNPANTLEWTLAEMINQPEILQKAIEEIDRVVGKERLVQESDFHKLNYVKACARESFRLHPLSAFNLPHVSNYDTTIAGYLIPKGSYVLLSRIGLGRNPKVWDEPFKFKPERHLKDGSDVDLVEPELRFISFSTGKRGCVGTGLGSAMTIMLLARLLQGFSWEVPPGESSINLAESTHSLFLAQPLRALAKPRLPSHVYPAN